MERIAPPSTDLTDPFWDATREHRYLVQWCTACDQPIFYPRVVCPTCLLDEASSTGPRTPAWPTRCPTWWSWWTSMRAGETTAPSG